MLILTKENPSIFQSRESTIWDVIIGPKSFTDIRQEQHLRPLRAGLVHSETWIFVSIRFFSLGLLQFNIDILRTKCEYSFDSDVPHQELLNMFHARIDSITCLWVVAGGAWRCSTDRFRQSLGRKRMMESVLGSLEI